jgi:4-oxalocrotonate tautomerase
MPVIEMTTSKMEAKTKKVLIEELMKTASTVTHIPEKFFTVAIYEMADENLGFAGETVAAMKARMKAKEETKHE